MRRERSLLLFVVLLGLGLLASAYAIWTLETQVRSNQSLIRQQQHALTTLLDGDVENKRQLSDQQRLVRALQAQVLKLGGKPLLTPPASPPPASSPDTTTAVPSTTPPRSGRSPSPTPVATPRSTPTQSPTPEPSATCTVTAGSVCLRGTG